MTYMNIDVVQVLINHSKRNEAKGFPIEQIAHTFPFGVGQKQYKRQMLAIDTAYQMEYEQTMASYERELVLA